MARTPEILRSEELDLTGLRKVWFNVDHESGSNDITSYIRHDLLAIIRKNWPDAIRDLDGKNDIEISRKLLDEGDDILYDVLTPASYGDLKISEAVDMVKRGEDPLTIQQVLDQVEHDPHFSGGNFSRAIMATAYLVAAFHLSDQVLILPGLPLMAQEIAARRQAAQNPQS